MFLILIIFIIIVTIVIFSGTYRKTNTTTKYIRITLSLQKLLKVPVVFHTVFQKRSNFKPTNNLFEADIVFFEKLTDFQSLYTTLPHDNQIYYSLACIDHISSKSRFYELLHQNLGVDQSNIVVPPTFILRSQTNSRQLLNFAKDTNSDGIIFKSNFQQQKGLKIVNEKNLHDFDHSKYVVAQKLLLNPYTINGRKINLRQYILVTCDKHSHMRFYAYNDGFVYYAPAEFKKTNLDDRIHITTGYGDRAFYKKNPLTIRDFQDTLSDIDRKRFNMSKMSCLNTIFRSIKFELQKIEKAMPAVKFNILGIDLHVTRDLKVLVMEVNKGCDLTFKDSRDASLKTNLVDDTIDLVLNGRKNLNFTRIA